MSEGPTEKTTVQQMIESSIHGLKDLVPAIALAVTLPLLVTHALPEASEKLALAIAAGLTGFLTGRATKA